MGQVLRLLRYLCPIRTVKFAYIFLALNVTIIMGQLRQLLRYLRPTRIATFTIIMGQI